jgi:hypothetical protein
MVGNQPPDPLPPGWAGLAPWVLCEEPLARAYSLVDSHLDLFRTAENAEEKCTEAMNVI